MSSTNGGRSRPTAITEIRMGRACDTRAVPEEENGDGSEDEGSQDDESGEDEQPEESLTLTFTVELDLSFMDF